jgi:hypothetical protein
MEQKCKVLFLGMCLFLLLNSCNNDQVLSPVEYVQWVKNPSNGFLQSKKLNEFEFSAQYKTLDFIVAQEERSVTLSKELLDARKKELGEDYLYYNFRIKNQEGNLSPVGSGAYSNQEYQNRLSYFTFEMQEDLYLILDQDTLPCTIYQFVRNYDVTPYVEFALGFEKSKKTTINQDITFVFEDRILGIGTTKLLFDKHIFENTLKIKTL